MIVTPFDVLVPRRDSATRNGPTAVFRPEGRTAPAARAGVRGAAASGALATRGKPAGRDDLTAAGAPARRATWRRQACARQQAPLRKRARWQWAACGGEPAHGGGRACGRRGRAREHAGSGERPRLSGALCACGRRRVLRGLPRRGVARPLRARGRPQPHDQLPRPGEPPDSFEEVLSIADEVRALDRRLYVTFNANAYSRAQLDFLFGYFERLREAGAAGVIVSVPEGRGGGCRQRAGGGGVHHVRRVQRPDSLRAARLGCTRVIVPRDVSLGEVECIMRAVPGLEYEVFLMRNGCIFSDCYCLGRHFKGRNALCFDVRDVRREFFVEGPPALAQAARENNGGIRAVPPRGVRAVRGVALRAHGRFRREDSGALGRLGVHFARHRDDPPQRGDCAGLRKRAGVPFSHARAARTRRRLRRGPELLLPGSALRVRVASRPMGACGGRAPVAPGAGKRRWRVGSPAAGAKWGLHRGHPGWAGLFAIMGRTHKMRRRMQPARSLRRRVCECLPREACKQRH